MVDIETISVSEAAGEVEFQKNQMIEYLRSWRVDEDTIDAAAGFFDIAIHGINDHFPHFKIGIDELWINAEYKERNKQQLRRGSHGRGKNN